MIQFDEHIFQMGWFNHQLEQHWKDYDLQGGRVIWWTEWTESSMWSCSQGPQRTDLGQIHDALQTPQQIIQVPGPLSWKKKNMKLL